MFKIEQKESDSMIPVFDNLFSGQNLYERTVMPVCRQFGLTYMEFTVLMFLHNNPQYDTAAQIVKIRRLTKSHVSISLRGLQERGLVKGEYFPGNQRIVHLKLTEAAQPIVAEGKAAQEHYGKLLLRGFTRKETEQLQYLMEKLNGNIKAEVEKNAEQ